MKVLFDHQAFTMQKYGGVSRYFSELMNQLQKNKLIDFDLALKYSDNVHIRTIKHSGVRLILPDRFKGKSIILDYLNKGNSIKKLKQSEFDFLHPTYYDPYFLNYLMKKPFILTVHDMTHELFPDKVNRWDKSAINKKLLADKASRIICVSQNTKNDLCRLLKVPEQKIDVVYLASSLKKPQQQKQNLSLPPRYVLYVGTRGYYKNFQTILPAIGALLKDYKDLFFVCAGGGKFTKTEMFKIESLGVKDKIIYREANDYTLPWLYSKAEVFIFPSLYEGFGIPLLEAFNCECPVITSNVSSLPEIAGDAAYYIKPDDPVMIREAVRKLLDDRELRQKLIQKGRIRGENFNWQHTAGETLSVYQKI